MPFNVRLADNEDALIHARAEKPEPRRRSKIVIEVFQGMVLGVVFMAALVAAYWLTTKP